MPDLVRLDIDAIENRIDGALAAFPDVAGAVFFGSALDLCRPDSDIDVGIVRAGALDPESDLLADLAFAEEVAHALGRIGRHVSHVTVLSLRQPVLAFEAFHTGRAVHVRDTELVTDLMEEASVRYRDDYPAYRAALQEINS